VHHLKEDLEEAERRLSRTEERQGQPLQAMDHAAIKALVMNN
jgi:hypothetical protein